MQGRTGARLAGRVISTSAVVAWEKVSHPKAGTLSEVPSSPAALTTQWLTEALCRGHRDASVTAISASTPSAGTSTRASLELTYNEAGREVGLPVNVFVKTTTSLTQRLLLGLIHIIEGEVGFFNRIRPLIEIEAPVGYYADYDRRTWRSVTIMEDLSVSKGAEFLDSTAPISRQDIEQLLTNLALMHGAMWTHPELTRSWLKTPLDHLENSNAFLNLRARADVGARRAEGVLPEGFDGQRDAMWDGFERSMRLASEYPQTFLHGDAHVGNTYRTAGGEVGWSDWQVAMKGCWAYDVAYAITAALTVEDRRAWERDLLALYLEELAKAGGDAPSFEAGWDTYRRHLFYPYFAWAFTIGRSAVQPKMQPPEYCLPIIERTSHALMDLDAVGAMSSRR